MRLVLSSLIFAAGLVTAAQAQDPASEPAAQPPAPTTAPSETAAPAQAAPPAPDATSPAAPPAPDATSPTAQPAAPAPAPEAPPPPPPALPTTGPGAEAISILEKVCVPAVRGQKVDDLAKASGFKKNRRDMTWSRRLGDGKDKNYEAVVYPQGANQSVCIVDFHYPLGQDEEVTKALNIWAFTHEPPLDPTANYTQPVDPDGLHRVRRSWEYLTSTQSIGLNFSTVRNPDGSQVNKNYDLGTMQYQERTF
jgi:hypothetical protein